MNAVVHILGKRAFKNLEKRDTNSENPYLMKVEEVNRRGEVKIKEQKRPVPENLSENDKKILKKVRRKAYKWDMSFRLCCLPTRFGWSTIIGVIPVIGDFADLLMALFLINTARRVDGGLPATLYSRMVWNIMIDFGLGLVPVVGDLVDMMYRANTRNAWLLDAYLTEKSKALSEGNVSDPESGKRVSVPKELRQEGDIEKGLTEGVTQGVTQVPPRAHVQRENTGRSGRR